MHALLFEQVSPLSVDLVQFLNHPHELDGGALEWSDEIHDANWAVLGEGQFASHPLLPVGFGLHGVLDSVEHGEVSDGLHGLEVAASEEVLPDALAEGELVLPSGQVGDSYDEFEAVEVPELPLVRIPDGGEVVRLSHEECIVFDVVDVPCPGEKFHVPLIKDRSRVSGKLPVNDGVQDEVLVLLGERLVEFVGLGLLFGFLGGRRVGKRNECLGVVEDFHFVLGVKGRNGWRKQWPLVVGVQGGGFECTLGGTR